MDVLKSAPSRHNSATTIGRRRAEWQDERSELRWLIAKLIRAIDGSAVTGADLMR